ncbi:hypothetical protein GGI43DRAFT_408311 [Trichoderma evansii]
MAICSFLSRNRSRTKSTNTVLMGTHEFTLAAAEKQAGRKAWAYRQFIAKTPLVDKKDAELVAGKTAIVTGSNIGLGLETARQLLDLGVAKLILAVRTVSKGEKARENLLAGRKDFKGEIEVWEIDMLSYDSIQKFAERTKTLDRLDIAILNAGSYRAFEEFHSSTGYEDSIQVNFLSTIFLSILLLPILKTKAQTKPGRLTLVSSDTASWAKFEERNERPLLPFYKKQTDPKNWNHAERYATSKLLGQLFISKLVEQVPSSAVTLNLVNPGLCYGTEIVRDGDGHFLGMLYRMGFRALGKPAPVGARSIVHAGVSFGEASHGQYTEDGEIRPLAALLYKPEGKQIVNQLWEETLAELPSAPVQESLQALSN